MGYFFKSAGSAQEASKGVCYEYTPFGGLVLASGGSLGTSGEENSFRFSTKYHDPETSFYYYGFRYYNPTTARWLSRDPIGEEGGINLYGFVSNYGVNHIDFLGLNICHSLYNNYQAAKAALDGFHYDPSQYDQSISHRESIIKQLEALTSKANADIAAIADAISTLRTIRNAAVKAANQFCQDVTKCENGRLKVSKLDVALCAISIAAVVAADAAILNLQQESVGLSNSIARMNAEILMNRNQIQQLIANKSAKSAEYARLKANKDRTWNLYQNCRREKGLDPNKAPSQRWREETDNGHTTYQEL